MHLTRAEDHLFHGCFYDKLILWKNPSRKTTKSRKLPPLTKSRKPQPLIKSRRLLPLIKSRRRPLLIKSRKPQNHLSAMGLPYRF